MAKSSAKKKAKRMEAYVPAGSKPVQMTVKRSTVPEGYERAIDHFEFDLTGPLFDVTVSKFLGFSIGVFSNLETNKVVSLSIFLFLFLFDQVDAC